MEKLDRLGWAAGFSIVIHGLRIGFRMTDPQGIEPILGRLPPGWRLGRGTIVDGLYSLVVGGPGPKPGVRRYHLLYGGMLQLARTMDLERALDALEADLKLYVAERARRRLFMHAGVVGWRGKAIVLPGRSYSGKSTLVQALVKAGATYYSDEYAVFDERGRVHPYLAPLSLRSSPEAPPVKTPPEALGVAGSPAPLPVGALVVTQYKPGGRWSPRPVSLGRATLLLLGNTVPARRRPQAVLQRLSAVAAQAPTFTGPRGEAEETARALLAAATW